MFSHSRIAAGAAASVLLVLFAVAGASAQCGSASLDPRVLPKLPVEKSVRAEPILPEAGFLSNTHYTSQFFGFSFDLPLTVQGHEIDDAGHAGEAARSSGAAV